MVVCVCVYCLHVCKCFACVPGLLGVLKRVDTSLETDVTGGYELWVLRTELMSSEKTKVLLTTEPPKTYF